MKRFGFADIVCVYKFHLLTYVLTILPNFINTTPHNYNLLFQPWCIMQLSLKVLFECRRWGNYDLCVLCIYYTKREHWVSDNTNKNNYFIWQKQETYENEQNMIVYMLIVPW